MKGGELKAIRNRLGWSQARLAAAVGVATNSIARQERGELGIRESLARLLRMLAEQARQNEPLAYAGPSRRNSASKPSHGFKSKNPQGKSRRGPR